MKNDLMTSPNKTASLVRALAVVAIAVLLAACDGCDSHEAMAVDAPSGAARNDRGKHEEGKHEEAGLLKLSDEESQRAGIRLQPLQARAEADTVAVTAIIHSDQNRIARVAPRVEGRITPVSADLGDAVAAGRPLAVLDSLVLGEAQLVYLQAQSAHRVALAHFQRAQALVAEEIIPQREFLRAKAELEKANAELRAGEDKLRLLGASLQRDDRAQASFQISAPLSGTVIQKNAAVGELATPSEPLFTVADLSKLWIEADLTEDLLSGVRIDAPASVTVTAERFASKVTYIAGASPAAIAGIPIRTAEGSLVPFSQVANIELKEGYSPSRLSPRAGAMTSRDHRC